MKKKCGENWTVPEWGNINGKFMRKEYISDQNKDEVGMKYISSNERKQRKKASAQTNANE